MRLTENADKTMETFFFPSNISDRQEDKTDEIVISPEKKHFKAQHQKGPEKEDFALIARNNFQPNARQNVGRQSSIEFVQRFI